ncbi:MAG: HAMP domain-containing sensor histidine kinase [Bacteroidota bacterium]
MALNIYRQKRVWKYYLFATGVLIVTVSLWYTNNLVQKIATEEQAKLKIWADAIQRKASFVTYTEDFFLKIKEEEQKRVHQWALATQKLATASVTTDISVYSEIVSDNTTIPVIMTDEKDNILASRNVTLESGQNTVLQGDLKKTFSIYPPIIIEFLPRQTRRFYYSESKLFSELRHVLDDLTRTFFSEVVKNSASVPVIVTDSSMQKILAYGNLDSVKMAKPEYARRMLLDMKEVSAPIELRLKDEGKRYIFYQSSFLLTQLRYFPFFQLGVITAFLFISYLLFSTARRSEQKQVWVGMAKETAHQLGTPISSIMAWVELMKMRNQDPETVIELEKDVKRLSSIAERFSKIGSEPSLKPDDLVRIVTETVEYLKLRTSRKVNYKITAPPPGQIIIPMNAGLFEWVIENVCKNSVDAMSGNGSIDIEIFENERSVIIDITDSGKGIPRSQHKSIFNPGFTSKKRGWGLGLTLAQRIIHEYHNGKIFVKASGINEGTTIRIQLLRTA